MDNAIWFLLAYIVGTGFGYYLGFTANARRIAEITIDALVADGYIKHKVLADGTYELLRLSETHSESKD